MQVTLEYAIRYTQEVAGETYEQTMTIPERNDPEAAEERAAALRASQAKGGCTPDAHVVTRIAETDWTSGEVKVATMPDGSTVITLA